MNNLGHMTNGTMLISEFYTRVLHDFNKKLKDKYNQKEKDFDSEMIDQIDMRIRAKINHVETLFPKALEIKHRSSAGRDSLIREVPQPDTEVKKQQVQIDQIDADDVVDYAQIFNRKQIQVKKEQGDENGIIKHEPNQDKDDEKDEEDERDRQQNIQKIKNGLISHIVGTYERESKKHVAKDQSTRLNLDNVFIQFKGNKTDQMFIPKLICQFRKE